MVRELVCGLVRGVVRGKIRGVVGGTERREWRNGLIGVLTRAVVIEMAIKVVRGQMIEPIEV